MSGNDQGAFSAGKRVIDLDSSKVPLPEEGDDVDAARSRGAGKRAGSDGPAGSPVRQRVSSVTVDVETLRALLAEQSASLIDKVMAGQQAQLEAVATSIRAEVKESQGTIMEEVRAQGDQIKGVQLEQQSMMERLRKLEIGASTSGSSTAEPVNVERHKYTLVYGGWARDTPKRIIIEQLHSALKELGVAAHTDNPCFTTGPRRTMCLQQFRLRSGESFQDMRERMQAIISAVSQSTVLVKGGGMLWAGYSKSRPERERGAHAALIRRVVRSLNATRETDLEVEYGSGTTWMDEFKLSSAAVPAEDVPQEQLITLDPQTTGSIRPWIDAGAIAKCAGVGIDLVREQVKAQQRR